MQPEPEPEYEAGWQGRGVCLREERRERRESAGGGGESRPRPRGRKAGERTAGAYARRQRAPRLVPCSWAKRVEKGHSNFNSGDELRGGQDSKRPQMLAER